MAENRADDHPSENTYIKDDVINDVKSFHIEDRGREALW